VRRGIAQGHAQAQGKSVMPAPMLSRFTFFALRSCISPQPAHFVNVININILSERTIR
jgi:hypothetical protein